MSRRNNEYRMGIASIRKDRREKSGRTIDFVFVFVFVFVFFPGPKYSESERWICQSQYEFGDVNVEAKH